MVIHGFSDTSKLAVCAAVYLIAIYDNLDIYFNLLVAESQIGPKGLFILHKELIAAHLLTNLMRHVKETLQKAHEISKCHSWVDSKIILYWLQIKGAWSRFVRTQSIKSVDSIAYHYVPTKDKPSDQQRCTPK